MYRLHIIKGVTAGENLNGVNTRERLVCQLFHFGFRVFQKEKTVEHDTSLYVFRFNPSRMANEKIIPNIETAVKDSGQNLKRIRIEQIFTNDYRELKKCYEMNPGSIERWELMTLVATYFPEWADELPVPSVFKGRKHYFYWEPVPKTGIKDLP
ncbi:MAG: hypothetical protein WCR31_08485 [Treponema sp.]